MDDAKLLEAISKMMDQKLEPINNRLVQIESTLETTNARLAKIEGTQEYTLKWLDRVEQRLSPVADYVETMYLNAGAK